MERLTESKFGTLLTKVELKRIQGGGSTDPGTSTPSEYTTCTLEFNNGVPKDDHYGDSFSDPCDNEQ